MTTDELPEPGDPPEDVDPELERLLTWFIRNNRRISWTYGYEQTFVAPHDTNLPPERKSKEVKFALWFSKEPPKKRAGKPSA